MKFGFDFSIGFCFRIAVARARDWSAFATETVLGIISISNASLLKLGLLLRLNGGGCVDGGFGFNSAGAECGLEDGWLVIAFSVSNDTPRLSSRLNLHAFPNFRLNSCSRWFHFRHR
uniref:Putative secreted protein n=1 Tax=Anopheles aquasalis TaxID=42839 RepID=T1DHE8_ANOAQ